MGEDANIEEICKNDILKLLSETKQNYSNNNCLIMKLIENQKESSKLTLEIEDEEIRKKTKIYSFEEFEEKINEPIKKYLNKMESQNVLLDGIKKELNDFLFQVEFQFGKYLELKKAELIYKESGEKNSKEEIFKKMYIEAQKAEVVLEYIVLRTGIKEIIQSILLISSIFEIKQIRNEFVERLKNSQEEINKIEIKIKEYDEKISNQDSKLKENNKKIKKQEKVLKNNTKKINNHDKRILEMMGIFLSIFSIIGLGTSSILNIENNHFAIWSMICGVILITMSGLFYMINYKDESTMNKRMMLPVIIGILLFCIGTVAIIKYPTENKTAKDLETRLKIVEEKIDYEKRINELEKKTK